jgi:transcriptional regulator with XRE-family HTH domain
VTGAEFKVARLASSLTQEDAAQKLRVTQAYLSMVERGNRPVSRGLASKAVDAFHVPPTALPLVEYRRQSRDTSFFKDALGALGYPGFAYLKLHAMEKFNPTGLLMEALDCEDLDARVIEALPWLPLAYPKLNWDWLTFNAKARDRQNRLGFVVDLARQVAGKNEDLALESSLAKQVASLERSRLVAEDTLSKESMTQAERNWLRTHRSQASEHWNLLTDLSVEHLDHAIV